MKQRTLIAAVAALAAAATLRAAPGNLPLVAGGSGVLPLSPRWGYKGGAASAAQTTKGCRIQSIQNTRSIQILPPVPSSRDFIAIPGVPLRCTPGCGLDAASRLAVTTSATLYKSGTGGSGVSLLAENIAVAGYSDPSEKECMWYHYIVRGDEANGVRLTVENLATGAAVVRDASLGEYDTVRAIALHTDIHGTRTIYAAIDNIKAYTFRKGGLVIIK